MLDCDENVKQTNKKSSFVLNTFCLFLNIQSACATALVSCGLFCFLTIYSNENLFLGQLALDCPSGKETNENILLCNKLIYVMEPVVLLPLVPECTVDVFFKYTYCSFKAPNLVLHGVLTSSLTCKLETFLTALQVQGSLVCTSKILSFFIGSKAELIRMLLRISFQCANVFSGPS